MSSSSSLMSSTGCLFHSVSSLSCLFLNHFKELCPCMCATTALGLHSSGSVFPLQSFVRTDLRMCFGDQAFSAAGPQCWNRTVFLLPFSMLTEWTHSDLSLNLICLLSLMQFVSCMLRTYIAVWPCYDSI